MFNPFNKNIDELTLEDLKTLIDSSVAEGWYIEYKSDFISPKKISHSIASFANSEGGWFFIGVKDNESNIATELCGFDIKTYPQPIEKIRDIVKNNISPIPQFKTKLIKCLEDRYLLIIIVEKGYQTPYTTKDGRIYRRVAEGSDPIPENDRYSLQKLFERNDEFKNIIESFSINNFSMSKLQGERNQLFVEAYFYIYPFCNFKFDEFNEKMFFFELYDFFNMPLTFIQEPIKANIAFNSFQSSYESYILKAIPSADQIIEVTLIIEIFENGNCKMIIPINELNLNNIDSIPKRLHGCEVLLYIYDKLQIEPLQHIRFIDGHDFFSVIAILFNQYFQLLNNHGYNDEINCRIKLSETWRKCIVYNSEEYLDYIKKYNIPVCPKSEIELPEFENGNTYQFSYKSKIEYSLIQSMLEGLGIPIKFHQDFIKEIGSYINSIQQKKK